ncbi:hypothetical protein LUZ60_004572 [Juncus effusus]|nr:hypothetical protein LUZ60_004572 [Juncus effusus]
MNSKKLPPSPSLKKKYFKFLLIFSILSCMENPKNGKPWMAVPVFGEWDMRNDIPTDYSIHFTKIRAMRKYNKKVMSWASVGDEEELANQAKQQQQEISVKYAQHYRHHSSFDDDYNCRPLTRKRKPSLRKKIARFFVCCVGG